MDVHREYSHLPQGSLASLTHLDRPLAEQGNEVLECVGNVRVRLVLEIDKVLVGVDEGGGRIAGEAVFRIA